MPGNNADDQEGYGRPIMTSACLLFLGLIVALWRYQYRRDMRNREQDLYWDSLWGTNRVDICHSLRRGNFSRETRELAANNYSHAQLVALGGLVPTALEVQAATAIFSGEILSHRGADFHLRHVIADNFLRRAVQHVLRCRQPERIALVRELFVAMNAQSLITTWTNVEQLLQAGPANLNWYQILGAKHVNDLRQGLNNTTGQLFYSERQGNLLTGTHLDVTGDTIGIIGEHRVALIVQAAVKLMESLNLAPCLMQVENEIFLGYSGASGAYRNYGYNPLLSHDSPEDPLRFLGSEQSLLIMSRSELGVVMRYLLRYHRTKTLSTLLVILCAIWYERGLPVPGFPR